MGFSSIHDIIYKKLGKTHVKTFLHFHKHLNEIIAENNSFFINEIIAENINTLRIMTKYFNCLTEGKGSKKPSSLTIYNKGSISLFLFK